ncbi:MAG: enoyl-CoA hydratase/isomerase family protein [Phycisphaerales bacterium]
MSSSEHPLVHTESEGRTFTITLNNAAMRNAMSTAMFDGLEVAIERARASVQRDETLIVILRGAGKAFCSGFNLAECVNDNTMLEQFVRRLGELSSTLRSMPAIVIAQVQGPALAGGCAIVAACDIVCATDSATFGYPVHRIGVSPAVSLPTLMATMGFGGARSLALSGEIIDAQRAKVLGLVQFVECDESALAGRVAALVDALLLKGPQALRATKMWLNQIDGTSPQGFLGSRVHDTIDATAKLCGENEVISMLQDYWSKRKGGS